MCGRRPTDEIPKNCDESEATDELFEVVNECDNAGAAAGTGTIAGVGEEDVTMALMESGLSSTRSMEPSSSDVYAEGPEQKVVAGEKHRSARRRLVNGDGGTCAESAIPTDNARFLRAIPPSTSVPENICISSSASDPSPTSIILRGRVLNEWRFLPLRRESFAFE